MDTSQAFQQTVHTSRAFHQTLHIDIYNAFQRSKSMQLAFHTTMNDLIKGQITWVKQHGTDGKTAPTILKSASHTWNHFIRKLSLQLLLYGYAIYRLLHVKNRSKKNGNHEEAFFPDVADGINVIIRFNKEKNVWEPESMPQSTIKGTKGWKLLIFDPPETVMRYTPNSAGYRSLNEYKLGEELMENLIARDGFNSKPSVFTSVSKSLTASAAQGRPWFNSVNSSMIPGPQPVQDFNTLVSDRAETIERLDELSERARLNTHRQYAKSSLQLRVGLEGYQPLEKMNHCEYFVSDGRDGTPISYLRGLENFTTEYDRIQNNILFAWNVPPQVLGKNINSERLASSNRLTEMAISQYECHIKILREYIEEALKVLSIIISGSDSTFITLIPCMSQYTLAKLEPVLKPDICKEQYACVFDLPVAYFDQEAIKLRQQTINEAGAQKERIEEKQKVTSTRPKKTEAQKDDTSKAKSEVSGS